MRLFIWAELGKPKIRNLGFEVGIKKDVAGFDIPVYDARSNFVVQICKASSSSYGNIEASWPIHLNQLLRRPCSANARFRIYWFEKPFVFNGDNKKSLAGTIWLPDSTIQGKLDSKHRNKCI